MDCYTFCTKKYSEENRWSARDREGFWGKEGKKGEVREETGGGRFLCDSQLTAPTQEKPDLNQKH